ncbi:hypothetical protein AGMMS50239_30390 [Bacteroidia bacterium]|nr:hypothetical protein AGMMS50239_30390 [Bacteroidia bacterium]
MGFLDLFRKKKPEVKPYANPHVENNGRRWMTLDDMLDNLFSTAWAEFQVVEKNNLLGCALVSPLSEKMKGDLKAKLMVEDYTSYKKSMQNYSDTLLEQCKLGNELWKEICGGSVVLTMSDSDIRKTTLVVDGKTYNYPQRYDGNGSNVSIILPYKLGKYPGHTLLLNSYENGNFHMPNVEKFAPKYLINVWNTMCR